MRVLRALLFQNTFRRLLLETFFFFFDTNNASWITQYEKFKTQGCLQARDVSVMSKLLKALSTRRPRCKDAVTQRHFLEKLLQKNSAKVTVKQMQWNPSIASVFSEFLHIQESYTRFSITSYEQVFLSQLSRLVSSSLFFVIKKYIPELNT